MVSDIERYGYKECRGRWECNKCEDNVPWGRTAFYDHILICVYKGVRPATRDACSDPVSVKRRKTSDADPTACTILPVDEPVEYGSSLTPLIRLLSSTKTMPLSLTLALDNDPN